MPPSNSGSLSLNVHVDRAPVIELDKVVGSTYLQDLALWSVQIIECGRDRDHATGGALVNL